eukprot:6511717-Alexandrium_andersonii.AAC.1
MFRLPRGVLSYGPALPVTFTAHASPLRAALPRVATLAFPSGGAFRAARSSDAPMWSWPRQHQDVFR